MAKKATLSIKGMTCQMCVKHVTKALQDLAGVSDVSVSLEDAEAHLNYDPDKAGVPEFKGAVAEAGYEVKEAQVG